MVKCSSVKSKKSSLAFWFDRSSSWSIVHQGKLSKELSRLVSFEVGLFSWENFKAIELSLVDNVECISLLSFNNNILVQNGSDLFHSVNHYSNIISVQVIEKNTLFNKFFNAVFRLTILGNHLGYKICLFIELSKNFCTDSLSTMLFVNFLLIFLFLEFFQDSSCFFWIFFFWIWVDVFWANIAYMMIDLLISLKEYSLIKEGMLLGLVRTIYSTRGRMTGSTWVSM